jgi:hypothetical protein
MILTKKSINKVIKNLSRSMPELPWGARRSTPILSYVLGGIGVAIVGGIAAVMAFSPRTRYRALDIAKDTYGKVEGKISHSPIGDKLGLHGKQPLSNGLASERGYSSTGL